MNHQGQYARRDARSSSGAKTVMKGRRCDFGQDSDLPKPMGDLLYCSICKDPFYDAMYLNWHVRNEHMEEVTRILQRQTPAGRYSLPMVQSLPLLPVVPITVPLTSALQYPSTSGLVRSWNSLKDIKRAPRKLKPSFPASACRRRNGSNLDPPVRSFLSLPQQRIPSETVLPTAPSVRKLTLKIKLPPPPISNFKGKAITSAASKLTRKTKPPSRSKLTRKTKPRIKAKAKPSASDHTKSNTPPRVILQLQPANQEPEDQSPINSSMETEPTVKPQTCFICSHQCATASALLGHMDAVHFHDQGPFDCKLCPFTCDSASDFATHTFRRCKWVTKFSCKFCPRDFVAQNSKAVHENRHETGSEEASECPECGVVYFRTSLLARHIMTDHK